MSDSADLTHDGFLGGALSIWQPRTGFRAATDAVLLAASVPATAGQTVLDLGCGVGTAGLCIGHRTNANVWGLEVDCETADLARRNAKENEISLTVFGGDVAQIPAELRALSFDHVLCNPPYYTAESGTAARNQARETALREKLPLAIWLDAATRRVKPGGTVSFIVSADRVPDLMSSLDDRLGAAKLLPLAARVNRSAKRVILQAQKGARSPFALLPPLVLHEGDRHLVDAPSETAFARSILRDGAALPL